MVRSVAATKDTLFVQSACSNKNNLYKKQVEIHPNRKTLKNDIGRDFNSILKRSIEQLSK